MLVCDTGPLLALLDADDPEHADCVELVERLDEDLVVPSPVLVELDYWVRKGLGIDVWRAFVEDVERGAYRVIEPSVPDIMRAAALEAVYEDLSLGYVDASVMALLERTGESRVATLDRRHFSVVRLAHCDALELLP